MEKPGATRSRCSNHPTVTAVATCDSCGISLCLECAVPVRGQVVGPECLPRVLPESVPEAPAPPPAPRRGVADRVTLAALAVVTIASLFPWNRFGAGSSAFGGWPSSPFGYASLVGPVAAVSLVAVWRASRPAGGLPEQTRARLYAVVGAVLAVLSVLSVLRPMPFSRAGATPYVVLVVAVVAGVSTPVAVLARTDRGRGSEGASVA